MKKDKLIIPLLLIFYLLIASSCEEPIYTPKPRGYPKVVYPEKNYQKFSEDYCSFTFERPVYAEVEQDTTFFDGRSKNTCWFNIKMDQFAATIHCSYVPISKEDPFEKLREDAFVMANEHIVKANYIDEIPVDTKQGVKGMAFDLEGPVASPFMFYLSDEKEHYFRGALYFNTRSDPDSLAPVIKFVKEDLSHMIKTFKWKGDN
ncbi:MAG: gliding motility-associated lipoprotein GldD [Polaribacter sp.]|jgi:gliding motility-associated lipoprotein GldD